MNVLISNKWNILLLKLILSLPKLQTCHLQLGIALCPIKTSILSSNRIKYLTLLGTNQRCCTKSLTFYFSIIFHVYIHYIFNYSLLTIIYKQIIISFQFFSSTQSITRIIFRFCSFYIEYYALYRNIDNQML